MPNWPWPIHSHPGTVEEVLAAVSHLHDHALNAIDASTSRILVELDAITARIKAMSQTLQGSIDTLIAEVGRQTTVNDSAIALINGFSARLQAAIDAATAAGASPAQTAQLTQLAASLTSNDDQMANAVAANTPAAP